MKKVLKLSAFLQGLVTLFILNNCSNIINTQKNTGYITIIAKFSEKQFNIKTIPESTNKIKLILNGNGITKPMHFDLTKEKPSIRFESPNGDKIISAIAIDDKNTPLAIGLTGFYVKENQNNKVELSLIEFIKNGEGLNPSPTPIPSSSIQPSSNPSVNFSSSPIPSSSPSTSPTPLETISPSPYENENGGSSSTNSPRVNANINVITSTPIPSGITIQ